mgnify:CR=1 FL=1
MRLLLAPLVTLGLSLALAAPAFAGQPVVLRPDVSDADGIVTLGDLFSGAGAAASTPVATRASQSVVLDARTVQMAARRAGLDWANAEGLTRIYVAAGAGGGSAPSAAAAGVPAAARGNVEVLTYARSLAAGEIVQPADLVWAKVAAAPNDAPSDAAQVIGLAARRPLRAGAAVAARDVSAPQVIKAGEIIAVVFQSGGITLSLQAKAMAAAAAGETLAVQNIDSKKVIQALAVGPGQALVGRAADDWKSASTRYALR